MQSKTWTYMDRSDWPRGEWTSEPDKMQWQDEATGLPCLIVRNQSGALCGYVGVAEGHPFFGLEYSDCSLPEAKPHGITEDAEISQWWAERKAKRLVCNERGYCDHTPESILEAHGGITFSDFCRPYGDDGERGICHVPDAGEPERVYWFGFDCAHSWDVIPTMQGHGYGNEGWYKPVSYVQAECQKLAEQLAARSANAANSANPDRAQQWAGVGLK